MLWLSNCCQVWSHPCHFPDTYSMSPFCDQENHSMGIRSEVKVDGLHQGFKSRVMSFGIQGKGLQGTLKLLLWAKHPTNRKKYFNLKVDFIFRNPTCTCNLSSYSNLISGNILIANELFWHIKESCGHRWWWWKGTFGKPQNFMIIKNGSYSPPKVCVRAWLRSMALP